MAINGLTIEFNDILFILDSIFSFDGLCSILKFFIVYTIVGMYFWFMESPRKYLMFLKKQMLRLFKRKTNP